MAIKFGEHLDLEGTRQLQRAVLHTVSGNPSSPNNGQVWYDSATGTIKFQHSGVVTLAAASQLPTNPVLAADYNAQSVLVAVTDDTPTALTVGQATVVGRATGGNVAALTAAQVRTIINVEDGATADQSAAEILAALLTVDGPGSTLDADTLDGTQLSDIALKSYVDTAIAGLNIKASVRAATTGNITLSGTQTIDGVSVIAADRVLVKAQTDAGDNGIYVAAAGAWSRSTDADSAAEITSALVFVREGTANENTSWYLETDGITLGTTDLVWTQFGAGGGGTYTAGAGLDLAGGEFSIETGGVTDAMLASDFTKKATTTVGDGSTTSFGFTHNLGVESIVWSVRDTGTDEMVLMMPTINSTNQATFAFATAPTTNQYEITVIG